MYTAKENRPFLAYIYFWYEALHPRATLYTDIPGMPALFTSTDTPDIANQGGGNFGENIMWTTQEGKVIPVSYAGDANGAWFDFYSEWPGVGVVPKEDEGASFVRYTQKAQAEGKGIWIPGTPTNDSQLMAWFYDSTNYEQVTSNRICTYTFPTGAVMEIRHPQDDSILIYRIRQNNPQYYQTGQAVTMHATATEILAALYLAKKA